MPELQLATPVALFIFNRPDATARVFEQIRQVRPQRLLIVADGPRADCPQDAGRCTTARSIVETVDWPCEVATNYAETNLGCRSRMASGLDWVFAEAEEAILLEDDCRPDLTFFRFCEELLARYRDEERVMSIAGTSLELSRAGGSYCFSRYPLIWGWASWRRAWRHYDLEMHDWPQLQEADWLQQELKDDRAADYWRDIFQSAYDGYNTWDYAWTLACWQRGGVAIHPRVNLVSNIGYGADATHTTRADDPLANLPTTEMEFPLRHPQEISCPAERERWLEKTYFSGKLQRLFALVRSHRALGGKRPATPASKDGRAAGEKTG